MYVRTRLRPAFTMIELIVVIGIIVLLATLSAATVMRVRTAQRETNTNNVMRAVTMGLNEQWKQAVQKISAEEPHEIIRQMTSKSQQAGCGDDKSRAKALHMYLRLRQEFPQTFTEARFMFSGQWQNPCTGQVHNLAGLNAMYGPRRRRLRPCCRSSCRRTGAGRRSTSSNLVRPTPSTSPGASTRS